MDPEEEVFEQERGLRTIWELNLQLAKFYYYLGMASAESDSADLALASSMKSLALMPELFSFSKRQSRLNMTAAQSAEEEEI